MSTSSSSSASRPSGGWQPPTLEEMQAMLPQYQFISLLGRGGMGAVYKAVQVSLDRAVAIKVLPGDLIDDTDAQFAERFKNEARTMAKMNHPAIVNVYDFGETQTGLLYIVIEFIDGTDVSKMIASQGKLPEGYALSITAHVCDALAYAHTHGIIHRDIKPANILINMEGAVKVADFGLAKANDPGQSGLTKTNMAMGTPDFVAPEALIPGIPLDGRADLYAIGVMLYQMLTGEIPRGIWTLPGTKLGTDPRFDAIITKAMQTDRDHRYQSAADLRRDLDTILTLPRAALIAQQQAAAEAAARAAQAQKQAASGPQRRPGGPPAHAHPPQPVKKKSSFGPVLGLLSSVVLVAGLAYVLKKPAADETIHDTKPDVAEITPKPAPATNVTPAPSSVQEPMTEPQPTVVNTPSPPVSAPQTPLPPGWTDLLANVDVQRDVVKGNWEMTPDGLEAKGGDFDKLLLFQQGAPEEYDFQIEFTFPGNDYRRCNMVLPLSHGTIFWQMAGNVNRHWFAFGPNLDGLNPDKPERTEAVAFRPNKLDGGHRYRCLVEVRKNSLRAVLDGEEVMKWSGDLKRFSGGSALKGVADAYRLGLNTYRTSLTFHKAEVRPVQDGVPVAASGMTPAPVMSSGVPAAVPAQVITFKGHRYELVAQQATWDEANAKARSMGGHLATLTTKEESDFVEASYAAWLDQPGHNILIGAIQEGKDAPWTWITYEPFEFAFWRPGEPNRADLGGDDSAASYAAVERVPGQPGWDDKALPQFPGFLVEWDDNGAKAPIAAGSGKALTKPVDLIKLVDLQKDRIKGRGSWDIVAGELVMKNDTTSTQLLAFRGFTPPEEYDYEVDFTITAGGGELAQVFPVAGHEVAWVMCGLVKRPPDPAHYALGPVMDGKYFDQRQEAVVMHPRIQFGRRHRSVVEVRKGAVRIFFDGEELLSWRGDFSRFDAGLHSPPQEVKSPGLSAYGTSITFHKVEIRPPLHQSDPRLVQLAGGFNARYDADAQKPFFAAVAALNKSYITNGIGKARAAAQAKGNLSEVTALDEVKARIERGEGVPETDGPAAPESLKSLRAIYRDAHAKLIAERDAKAAPLYDVYVKALDAYVAELTKANKLDLALRVKDFRADIASQKPAADTSAVVAKASSRPPAGATPPPPPKPPPSTGSSWRVAAEYLVNNGGTFVAFKNGGTANITTEKDIPAGRFDVLELTLDRFNSVLPPLKNADLQALAGLRDLRRVWVRPVHPGLSDAAFSFLSGNSDLNWLNIEYAPDVTDEVLTHLAGAKKIASLFISGASKFTGKGLEGMPFLSSLAEADFTGCGLNDDGLKALAQCRQLRTLRLNGTAVTDPGCAVLREMKTLQNLSAAGTAFGDEAAGAVADMTDLVQLDLGNTKITDLGLKKLLSLQKLTSLNLSGTPVTLEAAAEFQTALPQCRVSR